MSKISEGEENFNKKIKRGKKPLSQSTLVWLIAFLLAFSLILIGTIDYNADYSTYKGPLSNGYTDGTVSVSVNNVATAVVVSHGTNKPVTYFAAFNHVVTKNQNGGFLPNIGISIHDWIVIALIILCGLPAILIYQREDRRLEGIDNNLPYLLREIADSQRIGMTLPRAISEAAKRNYGPLTGELKKLAAKISWGIPFNQAMRAFRDSLDTVLARQATILILEAERSGGELEKIFDSAQNYVQELLDIKKQRENSIKPYIYIVFISYIIFVVVIYVLFTTFFAPFGVQPITSTSTRQQVIAVPLQAFQVLFLYLLTSQAFFSGLVAGKMGTGKIRNGLYYSTILMIVGLLTDKLLIVPTVNKALNG